VTAAAAGVSNSVGPWVVLLTILVFGSGFALVVTLMIVRLMRRGQPREQQLNRLAARLDGRSRVTIRTVEFSVTQADLIWVARSRGYSMVEHQFGRYYEFVYAPHPVPPGPWSN
jgi:membrane protein implicated in regulation of membrane protease activity